MGNPLTPSLFLLTKMLSLGVVAIISTDRSHVRLLSPHLPAIFVKIPFFDHFHHFLPFMPAYEQTLCPISACVDKNNFTGRCCNDIGWTIKKCSIKVKKKCTKKWRWPCRELKTWYMWNNIMVFLFAKKYSFYFDLFSWYGHLNVKYWQFWHWPNAFKICSEIVLCLLFLLQKNFYSR